MRVTAYRSGLNFRRSAAIEPNNVLGQVFFLPRRSKASRRPVPHSARDASTRSPAGRGAPITSGGSAVWSWSMPNRAPATSARCGTRTRSTFTAPTAISLGRPRRSLSRCATPAMRTRALGLPRRTASSSTRASEHGSRRTKRRPSKACKCMKQSAVWRHRRAIIQSLRPTSTTSTPPAATPTTATPTSSCTSTARIRKPSLSTKLQQRRAIGYALSTQVNAHEAPQCRAVQQYLFAGLIGQIEPVLHEVHAQHALQAHLRASVASLRVVRLDNIARRLLLHDLVHRCKEHVALGGAAVLFESSTFIGRHGNALLLHSSTTPGPSWRWTYSALP